MPRSPLAVLAIAVASFFCAPLTAQERTGDSPQQASAAASTAESNAASEPSAQDANQEAPVVGKIRNFIGQIRRKPQVMDVYFLAGADDFLLHVAARDTDDLRSFVVENLNADADVAGTQTSLIFEHLRGASPL